MKKNEHGFTLTEVLASALIVVIASIAMYVGIVYVENQIAKNYHDRVAIWHASGELDWQRYVWNNYKALEPFQSKSVPIDERGVKRIDGIMSYEHLGLVPPDIVLENIPYEVIEITVHWTEPSDNKTREVKLREDFYR
jgi:prepilin-type N-terminal cleavage/methylation domain-containing protein